MLTGLGRERVKPIQLFCSAVALVLLTAARSDSVPGIDITAMDRSIAPGDDFYRYANGNWQKRTEIPADRAAWGAFNTLDEEVTKRTRMLIENAGAGSPPESEMRKVSDFYASFMDQAGIEARGVTPLQPQLASISRISSKNELAEALGRTLRADVDPLNNTNFHTENLFGIWVAPGFADSDHYSYFANNRTLADI